MFELRIHGRGGQGVVTAAEVAAIAAFHEGLWAQAFPSFGSERMGAPVTSFCRMSERPIRRREPIASPNAVIIQDPTLLHHEPVFSGLREDGYLLVNTAHELEELGIDEVVSKLPSGHACAVAATEIAREHLGRAVPNAPLLGAFAALTGRLGLPAVEAALLEKFPGSTGEKNATAARAAYQQLAPDRAAKGADPHAAAD